VRALVAGLLSIEGIPHRTACHGGEALACIQAAPSAVVLLAMHMPEMSGPAFCRRLHAAGARDDIAIVVMTAAAQAAEYEQQCAADAILPKPFEIDQLLAVVDRFLHQDGRAGLAAG
jgi:CheY-like chemotaxis protein